jgi:hypothetical protein
VALEDLVHRRRLVHTAGDGLVVGHVERVGVEAAVPADHVERVTRHDMDGAGEPAGAAPAVLDEHLGGLVLADLGLGRPAQVALAVRGMLEQLAEARQVAAWRRDVAVRLDGVGLHRSARDPAMRCRARHDQVVARSERQVPEHGLEHALAGLDEHALVAGRVAIQR